MLKAPFPWFGGKSQVAPVVWKAFGDVPNYIEPFFGSGAALLGRPKPFSGVETVNDFDGFVCLGPDTRILRADLYWARAGDLQAGDSLIGFDEGNGPARIGLRAPTHYRHWCVTTVRSVKTILKPAYKLTFDDGTVVTASEDHLWLGGSHVSGGRGWRWQKTATMVCNRRTQQTWVCKLCDVVNQEHSYDAGWLAGFYDGEGHLQGSASGWALNLAQKIGKEADKAEALLKARGFDVRRILRLKKSDKHQQQVNLTVNGGMREALRFLMMIRPQRLIDKLQKVIHTKSVYGRKKQAVGLVEKEYLGVVPVVAIETDSHTFVAEGLASHNCNFWRAVKSDPEAVAKWADNPVFENDLHARHIWLLERKDGLPSKLEGDPEWYDAQIAGWWCWGICCWIGGGFCSGDGPWRAVDVDGVRQLVHLGNAGRGVNRKRVHLSNAGRGVNRKLVHLSDAGMGVNRQLVHLSNAGRGVNRQLVHLSDAGMGDESETGIEQWMFALADRLKRVRVCCGDWKRVCGGRGGDSLKHFFAAGNRCAVLLDPPYSAEAERYETLYRCDDLKVAHEVREWCIRQGDDPRLRIALCGYDGEHAMPDNWRKHTWKARGGYASVADGESKGKANAHREVIWFSPHCIHVEREQCGDLFEDVA